MQVELKNQKLEVDVDVAKTWALLWHKDDEGNKVDDFSIDPGTIHIELSGDLKIDTGSLRATSILNFFKVKSKLDDIHTKRYLKAISQE